MSGGDGKRVSIFVEKIELSGKELPHEKTFSIFQTARLFTVLIARTTTTKGSKHLNEKAGQDFYP